MKFYLDANISEDKNTKKIINDFYYWFNENDDVSLNIFTSSGKDFSEIKKIIKFNKKPHIKIRENPVRFEELAEYYSKPVLLNEIINYRDGDIFRIYKLLNPAPENNFDNQPISIQYDIQYDRKFPKYFKGYGKNHVKAVKEIIKFLKPKSILDAACGTGSNYFEIKEIVGSDVYYEGFDTSRYSIIKAMDYYSSEKAVFRLGDITEINSPDNKFDFSFTESTMPYVNNPIKALKELYRVSEYGFYCGLYTTDRKIKDFKYIKSNFVYQLDIGSTWKFFHETPNNFYIADFSETIKVLDGMSDKISYTLDYDDQFFDYYGINTISVFIYPKKWYDKNQEKTEFFDNRPLM